MLLKPDTPKATMPYAIQPIEQNDPNDLNESKLLLEILLHRSRKGFYWSDLNDPNESTNQEKLTNETNKTN
jgi:hypothetical protein